MNNNTATEAGSALDARQANPTIEGTMANQISQLNSDLKRTPKIQQTENDVIEFANGYIRIGWEYGINTVITYNGHIMEFNNGELLMDKSLF